MSLTKRLESLSNGQGAVLTAPDGARIPLTERLGKGTGASAPIAVEEAPRVRLTARLEGVAGMPQPPVPAVPAKPSTGLGARMAEVYQILQQTSSEWQTLPFGDWTPDLPDYANPGATIANNVIPAERSYGPMKDLSAASNALDARAQGAIAAQDTTGTQHLYAGDAAKLYLLTGTTFADASKSGGYSTAAAESWEFVTSQQTVIATNITDPIQSVSVGGATFADHITSTLKPKARHIDIIGDFVVLGNTDDATDGLRPERIWWDGINSGGVDYDPAAATQCDFQDQAAGGWVQRIVGGREYGLVIQERRISRMVYVGSPRVFRIDAIDRKRGTSIPNSVIGWGRFTFFKADEGFMIHDGTESIPIGHNKVDKTFDNQFDISNAPRVSVAVDPINKLVLWAFPGTGNVAGTPNKIFIFNWADRRWSDVDVDTDIIVRLTTQGLTLEGLDTIGTDIDNATVFPFSFDSRVYAGGQIKLGAFDTAHKLAFFDGANLAATIETGEVELNPGSMSKLTKSRPLIDGGTITAAVAGRNRLVDAVAFDTAEALDDIGEVGMLNESRYHRLRASIAAGGTWTHAQGMAVQSSRMGSR